MTTPEGARPPVVAGAAELAERVSATAGLVLGLDFDGTLAPIVTDPDAATIDPSAVSPLVKLRDAEHATVAICSGRALRDLTARIPLEGVILLGNHGLEEYREGDRQIAPEADASRDSVAAVRDRLTATLRDVPGCRIEDKGPTLSVHVRETPVEQVPTVRETVEDAVAAAPALHLVTGKAVFEIRPAVAVDKGTAMARVSNDVPDDWLSVYVGDDTTDEDAFRALQPAGVGINVGDQSATAADYALPEQAAVPAFLRWLAGTTVGDSAGHAETPDGVEE